MYGSSLFSTLVVYNKYWSRKNRLAPREDLDSRLGLSGLLPRKEKLEKRSRRRLRYPQPTQFKQRPPGTLSRLLEVTRQRRKVELDAELRSARKELLVGSDPISNRYKTSRR